MSDIKKLDRYEAIKQFRQDVEKQAYLRKELTKEYIKILEDTKRSVSNVKDKTHAAEGIKTLINVLLQSIIDKI